MRQQQECARQVLKMKLRGITAQNRFRVCVCMNSLLFKDRNQVCGCLPVLFCGDSLISAPFGAHCKCQIYQECSAQCNEYSRVTKNILSYPQKFLFLTLMFMLHFCLEGLEKMTELRRPWCIFTVWVLCSGVLACTHCNSLDDLFVCFSSILNIAIALRMCLTIL